MRFFSDSRARRQLFIALFFTLLVTFKLNGTTLQLAGDWAEYVRMTHSLMRHGTPDWRASDKRTLRQVLLKNGVTSHDTDFVLRSNYQGFYRAHNGGFYSWHFWFYSLLAVPFYLLLLVTSGNPLQAFEFLNILLLFGGCFGACKILGGINARSVTLVGLSAVGPVLLITKWVHAETFLWCCVLLAMAFLLRRRYALAALCFAVGSWQNSPLLLAAFCCAFAAFLGAKKEGVMRPFFASVAAACVAFVPMGFYFALFGVPSLISREGYAGVRYASWSKMWSLLFDLNHGLILFAPGLLLLFFAAIVFAVKRRKEYIIGLALLFCVLAWAVTWTPVWLAAMAGVQRYAVWLMPMLAGVVAAVPRRDQTWRAALGLAVLIQAALVAPHDGRNDSLEVKPAARLVWDVAPSQYNPEYVVFGQRVLGREGAVRWRQLPVSYISNRGDATKILVDAASLATLPQHFRTVDKNWWREAQRENRGARGWFYIHPPRGAVRP